ncbi:histidine phosphatase family protein [Pseudonocardia parietis]|uniref:Broad specificity phosphatase PhoE n=1 Tax=Pseudonocardia parietis TaxID=570936 RepID=A0ABS4VP16_9PSEU|nr:histidine phosphatase family protein [Pseudonocardia parietis]MBP2365659.1 broad specificity phosphatase PhoE [Pseudonocardia parietis]
MGDRTSPAPEGPATVVHLLRHGEVHNPEKLLYGRRPGYRLSDLGEAQAKTVAVHLGENDVAAVVASSLLRAQQTAQPIADAHGVEITTDDGLIESGNLFEGKSFAVGDGALRHPQAWRLLRNPFTPSWGEPYRAIAHRMLGAVHAARLLAPGREIVCVSHQLPIWTLRRYLLGQRLWHDPRRRQCSLASLTSIEFTGARVTGLRYSEPAGSSGAMVAGA